VRYALLTRPLTHTHSLTSITLHPLARLDSSRCVVLSRRPTVPTFAHNSHTHSLDHSLARSTARAVAGELQGIKGTARRSGGAGQRIRGSNDVDAILAKHKEMAVSAGLSWVECNLVSSPLPPVSAQDDIARENAFYDHTLIGVQKAFALFKANNVPIRRPSVSRSMCVCV
jgi:hypothetical protein